jgi:uncharacterized membrane protein
LGILFACLGFFLTGMDIALHPGDYYSALNMFFAFLLSHPIISLVVVVLLLVGVVAYHNQQKQQNHLINRSAIWKDSQNTKDNNPDSV